MAPDGESGMPDSPLHGESWYSAADRLDERTLTWLKKRNGDTLKGALAFVPWVLHQSYFDGSLDDAQVVIHRGTGAVVFCDVRGFSALTDKLATKGNGAELLSKCLTDFYTPLITLINAYRGDVIKFSGDALTVYFQAVDDTKGPKYNCVVPPHGTYGLPDLGPVATAVLRGSACCIEIHKRLNMFATGVEDLFFCLHNGVGCGPVNILQVGGVVPPETNVARCEYVIAGPPLEQISIAEPLAKDGQTCLSPQAWEYVKDCVHEGPRLEDRPDFHLLRGMDESKYTFPTIKHAAMENDSRMEKSFRLSELTVIRRYIPSAVFKQIECGTLDYVNEMRNISVIFISCSGIDVMSDRGAQQAQDLMAAIQSQCYAHEGTLNKFLIDDKGMTFLLVFGLPPLVHIDDATRAVLACFDMVKTVQKLGLDGRFGITSGRSYCGVVGSASRMEYTVLGDCVNLASRLMKRAPRMGILCDENTKNKATAEIVFNALTPIEAKGTNDGDTVPVFQPVLKEPASQIGLTKEARIRFPWYDHPFGGGGGGAQDGASRVQQLCSVRTWSGIVKVQSLLGGSFDRSMHSKDQTINTNTATTAKPPEGSPFAEGGSLVIEGPTGMGKIELAEHIVTHCAVRFRMLPVFGTMGPRPGGSIRMGVELLRSTLGVFRHFDPSLPSDDSMALSKLVASSKTERLPLLREALCDQTIKDKSSAILDSALDVVSMLLQDLKKSTTSIILVLQYEFGTSSINKTTEDQKIFWKVVDDFTNLVKNKDGHPAVMMILCRDADMTRPAVKLSQESDSFLHLSGLTDENILEYMCNYLGVPDQMVPHNLRQFIAKVTLGNPEYIRQTLDQLKDEQEVQIDFSANRQPRNVACQNLDKVNLSAWGHTEMVGRTVCLLESLDPLEGAVLKMSTCFLGPFTLPDLAASNCSPWAGAAHFDFLRLFKALHELVRQNIIEKVDPPKQHSQGSPRENAFGTTQHFQCTNLLIRSVGGSMVLEVQRKSVKRQALIDRALSHELPARLEKVANLKSLQHIPWYYEQAFRRMM